MPENRHEITFEVTVYALADEGQPTPDAGAIRQAVAEGLSAQGFTIDSVTATEL